MDVDPIPVTILEVPKQFKASIPVTVVSGINSEKLGKISHVFYHYDSFEHAIFINKRNKSTKTSEKRIQICFTNKEDFDQAISKEYNWSDEEGAAPIKFVNHELVKPTVSEQELEDEKSRTIQVVDIPLFVKKNQIELAFSRFGKITKVNTKAKGLYQQAYVTFEHVDMIKAFYTKWSFNINNDAVRVIPINLSEEQRDLRNLYCLKLAGFPYRFPTAVLLNLLREFNAKAIFVPRRPRSYINMNYAFVYFMNEDDMQTAQSQAPNLQLLSGYKKELFWALPDDKTCHLCGSPEHMAVDCEAPKKPKPQAGSVKRAWSEVVKNGKKNKNKNKKSPTKPQNPSKPVKDLEKEGKKVVDNNLNKINSQLTEIMNMLKEVKNDQEAHAKAIDQLKKTRENITSHDKPNSNSATVKLPPNNNNKRPRKDVGSDVDNQSDAELESLQ